ncbi:hypothetical protein BRADI_1g58820v3 [Brachypodium distachyon]|uniref:Homeobox domain-containing protein n=1 Tax=Brachypodium distachyon TaxID=15368 RepID=A0A0Q3NUE6_BRADI|nr:hypothetical protein BRADI_1g58820v3 [Brachypodium distachyon]
MDGWVLPPPAVAGAAIRSWGAAGRRKPARAGRRKTAGRLKEEGAGDGGPAAKGLEKATEYRRKRRRRTRGLLQRSMRERRWKICGANRNYRERRHPSLPIPLPSSAPSPVFLLVRAPPPQIKNLAGELGLDRGLVIELLRNPPPKLLLMSDSLPDEAPSKPQVEEIEPSPVVDEVDATETKPQMDIPIHVMSAEWSTQKRLKKVQLETLERIYLRSKRPTNTMVSSIVQVTSLPRKTIVNWFEDRREQDGVPDHRAAYKRPLSETIAS